MAMAGNEGNDLSVKLDWPEDPISAPLPIYSPDDGEDPGARLEARLEALTEGAAHADPDDLNARIDFVVSQVVAALSDLSAVVRKTSEDTVAALDERISALRTATMSMLASRQAAEQRTQRALNEAVAASRAQSDVFSERVASELQSLRRRL